MRVYLLWGFDKDINPILLGVYGEKESAEIDQVRFIGNGDWHSCYIDCWQVR